MLEKPIVAGLFSVLVAIVSGIVAFYSARSNFKRDLVRIQAQLDAQQGVAERERLADLRQRFLVEVLIPGISRTALKNSPGLRPPRSISQPPSP